MATLTPKNVTLEDLALMVAEGFNGVDARFNAVDGQFDGQFLMTCYDCGKYRKLHVDMSDQPEKRHLMASPSKSK